MPWVLRCAGRAVRGHGPLFSVRLLLLSDGTLSPLPVLLLLAAWGRPLLQGSPCVRHGVGVRSAGLLWAARGAGSADPSGRAGGWCVLKTHVYNYVCVLVHTHTHSFTCTFILSLCVSPLSPSVHPHSSVIDLLSISLSTYRLSSHCLKLLNPWTVTDPSPSPCLPCVEALPALPLLRPPVSVPLQDTLPAAPAHGASPVRPGRGWSFRSRGRGRSRGPFLIFQHYRDARLPSTKPAWVPCVFLGASRWNIYADVLVGFCVCVYGDSWPVACLSHNVLVRFQHQGRSVLTGWVGKGIVFLLVPLKVSGRLWSLPQKMLTRCH